MPEALSDLTFLKASTNNVHTRTGRPLARFEIADINSTKDAALIITANHSTFNAISFQAFIKDLSRNLSSGTPSKS